VGACTANGANASHAAEKFGFSYCTTDEQEILNDPAINTVVIVTRHHLHAGQVLAALSAGKHVFCEKPLCLTEEELGAITRTCKGAERGALLTVGFNRRFAPMALRMKEFLKGIHDPLSLHYRVNAGPLPPDHWVNDSQQGGGRILGEVCHFIDFLTFLAGTSPIEVQTRDLTNSSQSCGDNAILSLQFADGSQGTISYLANGDRTYSKERTEVFGEGAVAVLDDFRRLELVRHGRKKVVRSRFRQDKGHRGEWEAFTTSIRSGGPSPILFDEIVATTLATLRAVESRSSGRAVPIDTPDFIRLNSDHHPDS